MPSKKNYVPGVPKKSIPKIKVFLQKVMVRDFNKNISSKYFPYTKLQQIVFFFVGKKGLFHT